MNTVNWVGVMGNPEPRRSVMDQKLQREFNPYYAQSQENYCGSGVKMPMSSSNPNRPNWMIDNPYNPMSSQVSYQPLM